MDCLHQGQLLFIAPSITPEGRRGVHRQAPELVLEFGQLLEGSRGGRGVLVLVWVDEHRHVPIAQHGVAVPDPQSELGLTHVTGFLVGDLVQE